MRPVLEEDLEEADGEPALFCIVSFFLFKSNVCKMANDSSYTGYELAYLYFMWGPKVAHIPQVN